MMMCASAFVCPTTSIKLTSQAVSATPSAAPAEKKNGINACARANKRKSFLFTRRTKLV